MIWQCATFSCYYILFLNFLNTERKDETGNIIIHPYFKQGLSGLWFRWWNLKNGTLQKLIQNKKEFSRSAEFSIRSTSGSCMNLFKSICLHAQQTRRHQCLISYMLQQSFSQQIWTNCCLCFKARKTEQSYFFTHNFIILKTNQLVSMNA